MGRSPSGQKSGRSKGNFSNVELVGMKVSCVKIDMRRVYTRSMLTNNNSQIVEMSTHLAAYGLLPIKL